MNIRPFSHNDLPAAIALWNGSAAAGETVYRPLTEETFHLKFEADPNYDPALTLVAEEDGAFLGFISGIAKKIFLQGENSQNTPGFITCVFVAPACRGRGVGKALVTALEGRFRAMGKTVAALNNDNPVNLDWIIPGTPGHDHNNAPGVDEAGSGLPFFEALGYRVANREIAMYLNLTDYIPWEGMAQRREALKEEGIEIGPYDARLGYDYDGMCDRVHSDYWREVLRSEIACHLKGVPNTDPRFIPNGKVPAGPRPILTAVSHPHRAIIAQTGPIDLQDSGRGWFTGICTDPLFEHRGIASVLFNVMMQEFIREGAAFSTLFTGDSNHAQKIYLRTGFKVVRRFAQMHKSL